jgi:pantetheine-phosphate adenylyltransferase
LKEVIENRGMKNVEVKSFSGLLIDFAKENKAGLVIRGLRAVTDFEYEFQMALTNRTLSPDLETLLIPTNTQYLYLSSSIVKEIARYGGNIDEMVPPEIKSRLLNKFMLKEE